MKRAASWILLGIWVIFTLFPLYWVVTSSLKQPADVFSIPPTWVFKPTLKNYRILLGIDPVPSRVLRDDAGAQRGRVNSQSPFLRNFVSSVIVSSASTMLALLLGLPVGYTLARFRFRFRGLITSTIFLARLLPAVAILIPVYTLLRQYGLLGTYQGLIMVHLTFNLPLVVWMMRGYFAEIPAELEEAARVDGATRWGALLRVIVPIAWPGVGAAAIMAMILSWNEFMFATMLTDRTTRTLTALVSTYITDTGILWGRVFAAATIILLPIALFSLVVQGQLAQGLQGATKG